MKFDWDPRKAKANLGKHRVSFDEGATVFLDPMAVSGPVSRPLFEENRYITFGFSRLGRLLAVCAILTGPVQIRIINVRRVTRGEKKLYEED